MWPEVRARYFRRNSIGSAPAAAASSSMKHSLANVFCNRPGVLIQDGTTLLGAIGISGDTSDNDEMCAIAGIEAAGLKANPG